MAGFSIIDRAANINLAAEPKSIRDYRSDVFGYRFRARARGWLAWTDLEESNDGADIGVLSARGYGAVVMPFCWQGARPTDNAVYRVMMQQLGEDYPSDFITEEHDIKKGGAALGRSPLMAPWGGILKEKDVEDVIAYLRTFTKKK